MYIDQTGFTYYSGSEQRHTRAPFLMLASSAQLRDADGLETLYACVRSVAYQQLGNFMMGRARVGGQTIILSGQFGSDGLPLNLDDLTPRARACFAPVSPELGRMYWRDQLRARGYKLIARAAPRKAPSAAQGGSDNG